MILKKKVCGGGADQEVFVLGKRTLPLKKEQGKKGGWQMPGPHAA